MPANSDTTVMMFIHNFVHSYICDCSQQRTETDAGLLVYTADSDLISFSILLVMKMSLYFALDITNIGFRRSFLQGI